MLEDIEKIIREQTSGRLKQVDKVVSEHSMLRSLKRHWEGITLLIVVVIFIIEVVEWNDKREKHG